MFRNFVNQFKRDCVGGIAVYFALLMGPLALATGAAIDVGRASHTQAVLQKAADAAALAGAAQPNLKSAELAKIVEKFAAANGAPNIVSAIKELKGTRDVEKATFTVSIKGKMKTSLMQIAGISEMDISVQSVVTTGSRAVDLAMALDVTGSMNNSGGGGGTRLELLKKSATRMIDILNAEKASYAVLRVGVVPFAQYVNVGTGSAVPVSGKGSTWEGCVGSRAYPSDVNTNVTGPYPAVSGVTCPSAAITPLNSNLDVAKSAINKLVAKGNTYIPAGVQWGWQILSESAPFSEGMSPEEIKNLQGFKFLILMTDGTNTVTPTYPLHSGGNNPPVANALTEASCAAAKADGISIFSITFMVDVPETQTMMDNCATEKGMSFDANSAADLDKAFTAIGKKLNALRLKQ
jgi:Flp pilus assembly protein TadG